MRDELIEAWADELLTTTRAQCVGEYQRGDARCALGLLYFDVMSKRGMSWADLGPIVRTIGVDMVEEVQRLNDAGWSFKRIAHMLKAQIAEPARELVEA